MIVRQTFEHLPPKVFALYLEIDHKNLGWTLVEGKDLAYIEQLAKNIGDALKKIESPNEVTLRIIPRLRGKEG